MNYDNMCYGSEELDAQPALIGTRLTVRLCRRCDSWVSTGVPSSGLVPVHEKPYSEAEEAVFQRNAAATIRWEYAQARRRGTLIIADPNRWHTTALGIARPRKHLKGAGS